MIFCKRDLLSQVYMCKWRTCVTCTCAHKCATTLCHALCAHVPCVHDTCATGRGTCENQRSHVSAGVIHMCLLTQSIYMCHDSCTHEPRLITTRHDSLTHVPWRISVNHLYADVAPSYHVCAVPRRLIWRESYSDTIPSYNFTLISCLSWTNYMVTWWHGDTASCFHMCAVWGGFD